MSLIWSPSYRARRRKPSCLISGIQLGPLGGALAFLGRHGSNDLTGLLRRARSRCTTVDMTELIRFRWRYSKTKDCSLRQFVVRGDGELAFSGGPGVRTPGTWSAGAGAAVGPPRLRRISP